VVAAYLLLLRPGPWLASGIVGLLCVLVFVPMRCVYPTRTRELRRTTLVLAAAWGAVLGFVLWRFPDHPRPLVLLSLAFPAYYFSLSFLLWLREARSTKGRAG
jgi:phosphatidylcholine synthase